MVADHARGVNDPVDVLVVGAGPTGLATALMARRHGARVRIVERRSDAVRPSRAMIVHSRALEGLRPLGATDALLERADPFPRAELHVGARRIPVRLAQDFLPDSSVPPMLLIRQMAVEDVLANELEQAGVHVERGTELLDLHQSGHLAPVRAVLRTPTGVAEVGCRFLAACDGSGSTVRQRVRLGFQGAAHQEEVVLADVELAGSLVSGRLHVAAGGSGLVWLFPLGEGASWRLIGTRPARTEEGVPAACRPSTTPDVVSVPVLDRLLEDSGLGATVTDCPWSCVVPLQHRLAQCFRRGPVFLVGDAAHVHSPAAAQGMNSGLLDAVNLGWKLAFAARTGTPEALLDSYGAERRPVARQVIALTRLVFFAEASQASFARLLRSAVLPAAAPSLPYLLTQPWFMQPAFRLLSQRWVSYRHSALSLLDGHVPSGPRPGDRLPDRDVTSGSSTLRLHALTAQPGIHLLLERDASTPPVGLLGPRVTVHRLDDVDGRGVVAVRPDGHVGYRSPEVNLHRLTHWLDLVAAR
jgi:2-polyprenyl-6-methoxyphenol hydroxylase-like FAD-dependent oxidoreductase